MKSLKRIGWCLRVMGLLGGSAASASSMATLTQELADAQAWREQAHWRVAMAPHTEHYRPSGEHQSVWAVALERQRRDGWLAGASRFSNSFGQPSAYIYVGHRFDGLLGQRSLYGQLSAGLLYGYRGRFEDKVPLNHDGFSPGALATIGSQLTRRAAVAAHFLGDAGVMLQVSWDLR
ncbi:MAG: hypothetical protein RL227_422 [Pseudomonadota bacterium]|jgi:hypothetical protein